LGGLGKIIFRGVSISGCSPVAGHKHHASFELVSSDRFSAKWDFVEGGKVKFSEEIRYTRVK
jgi:hypothetical protein